VAEASSLTRLDSCTLQVEPPMSEAMEHLRLPENLMKQLHIVADRTPTGLVLTGENCQLMISLLCTVTCATNYYCETETKKYLETLTSLDFIGK